MKKKILLFLVFLPCFVSSQTWQQYSDSLIHYINKNNLEKANYFDNLIDSQLNYQKIIKDTIYADYLYRKGVLSYKQGKFSPTFFEASISIWNKSNKINNLKLIKNYYFLAQGYNVKNEFSNAYIAYEKCYQYGKKYNLIDNVYYLNSIYCLSVIDYKENFNFKKAELFATEYIDLNSKLAYLNFDFNYAYAFRWKEDLKGYENTLLVFDQNYKTKGINNPELYFQINYLLFECYWKYINYEKQDKFTEMIKFGEESLRIYDKLTNKNEKILKNIYIGLLNSYEELNDIENIKKYENLIKNLD